MRLFIYITLLLIAVNASAETYEVAVRGPYPFNTSDIARQAVTDVKEYYSTKRSKAEACGPKPDADLNSSYSELISHKSITKIEVAYYDSGAILMNLIFKEPEIKIALNVQLKNNSCVGFIFYEASNWSDPN